MDTTPRRYEYGTVQRAPLVRPPKGNRGTKKRRKYKDLIITFDIETTRLQPEEQSVMYVWQVCILHRQVIIGRTWAQLEQLLYDMSAELDEDEYIVIYVHNLAYEFQFLRAIHEWEEFEIFALDKRKVCKATWEELRIEFRCSYIHSNMSLAEFTAKMGVEHGKLSGDEFNYNTERLPWTPLTDREIEYCVNDVVGLAEALEKEMLLDGDTLYTIPATSTGYVRRDAKRALHTMQHNPCVDIQPTWEVYELLREAFRGGNTHANRYFASGMQEDEFGEPVDNHILHGVKSADRSSSYPDVQCNCLFPMSEFKPLQPCTTDRVIRMIGTRRKALLMRVAFTNIRLRDPYWGCPYLSTDKCRRIRGAAFDNGRILSAEYLEVTLTDVDFEIVLSEYDSDDTAIFECYAARYGTLPQPLIDVTIGYYRAKTELKGIPGQEIYYMKCKNKLNSIYGMMATNPVRLSPHYCRGDWLDSDDDPREKFDEYLRNAFLCYQHGVWVTAWARLKLEQGIRLAHGLTMDGKPINWQKIGKRPPSFVYCDTDSVKYTGVIDWTEFNRRAEKASTNSGAFAADPSGEVHFMGVFEDDVPTGYADFATMGAKKYAYVYRRGGRTNITIAGVTKKKGGRELDDMAARSRVMNRRGRRCSCPRSLPDQLHRPILRKYTGIDLFRDGTTFHAAGGLEAVYNDHPEIRETWRDGKRIGIYPNIVLRPSSYTLGLTAEYRALLAGTAYLENWKFDIDK